MPAFNFKDRTYQVDDTGFLQHFMDWDEGFAEGMAPVLRIPYGLRKEHWDVINYIRSHFKSYNVCPLVYQTCRVLGLRLKDLQQLFPTGYQRGACRLAGITYKESYQGFAAPFYPARVSEPFVDEKHYVVDARGFLINPDDWDERFAVYKAVELKMLEKLSEKQWQILHYLRAAYKKAGEIPTVYDVCLANNVEIEDLEKLFPDGYHRGAVKLAGLRLR